MIEGPPPGPDEILVVVGPTASGKTELALELADAYGGEIVGADSVQIYRGFCLGASAPSDAERARAPHHLVGVVDPKEPIDAAGFATLARTAIEAIRARGRVPIVCGGTFFWIRALIYGLAGAPPGDAETRARHKAEADSAGRAVLHARLAEVDAAMAARLAPNDFVRVSRALEVWEMTGKPLSKWQSEHGFARALFTARFFGVAREPAELAERIAVRTRRALEMGWLDEVRGLVGTGYRDTRPMGSVGYRQVLSHLEGSLAAEELAPAIDRATRVFTRRQRTWLRDVPVTWIARTNVTRS